MFASRHESEFLPLVDPFSEWVGLQESNQEVMKVVFFEIITKTCLFKYTENFTTKKKMDIFR